MCKKKTNLAPAYRHFFTPSSAITKKGTKWSNFTFLAEVAGGHGFVEPLLDLMVDELHKGIVLGKR